MLAILLTQSRGALAAALLGSALWLAIVPLRLRSLPVLLIPALAGGGVGAWALSKDAFSESLQPLAVKEAVAGEFGLLVLLMVVGLLFAGCRSTWAPSLQPLAAGPAPRGIAAVVVACAVPLVVLTSVALSGTIDDRLDELTSETETAPGEGAGRFTATASSTRGKYWREAGDGSRVARPRWVGRRHLPDRPAAFPQRRSGQPSRARVRLLRRWPTWGSSA